ncbi:hypothetical protein PACTADRAFT_30882, partial [Pachysolen tannophilus NRRL Y-2460]
KTRTHLISGFTGGLTSAVALQPFDLLKTRIQQTRHATLKSALGELHSVRELWRGTLPSALRTSIGSALYLTFLNSSRSYLFNKRHLENGHEYIHGKEAPSSSRLPKLSAAENLLTGMFARTAIGFVTMPITIIKVRYESRSYNYSSIYEAASSILKNEGIKGCFSGFWATAARDAPYAGLYVLFYEKLKVIFAKAAYTPYEVGKDYNTSESALINSSSAIIAASCSTLITGPFDTIKTVMQLDPKLNHSLKSTVVNLYKSGGFIRFFDGMSLRLIRKGCSAGISWCIYEELIKYF